MGKKGQISIFFILGFIIIIAVGLVYSVSKNNASEKRQIEAGTLAETAFSSQK